MYICKNCGKEFERACQLGGHVIQCIYHIQENIFLQSIKQYNNNPNLCFFCKGPILHVSGYLNETKNKKFCDSSCAAKFNNHKRRKEKLCFNCGKPHTRENADYCSKECVESIKAQKCWGKVERNEKIKVSIVKNYLIKERGHKCQTCGGTE